jgi:hypothetical protein
MRERRNLIQINIMSIYHYINKFLFTHLKMKFMKIYCHLKYFTIISGPICMKLQKMIKDGVYVSKFVKVSNSGIFVRDSFYNIICSEQGFLVLCKYNVSNRIFSICRGEIHRNIQKILKFNHLNACM